jgi:hypothetical protein
VNLLVTFEQEFHHRPLDVHSKTSAFQKVKEVLFEERTEKQNAQFVGAIALVTFKNHFKKPMLA